ncbi:hypothetical protein [Sphingobacterium humi]|uniref:Uncharacterized protein n=1 Tax=Sphingobacterium humi TaxID=1796905 RepID=A0A6N8L2C5_9SPHI|nr:hypothetical protein [Sphingobacterium humi]MVZ62308.1 hypothetical protein [Sphingobacterium humi]
MKKILYLIGFLCLFQSCEKESFPYETYQANADEIDSIYFSPGSNSLIADGKATLQFVLEAFRKVAVSGPNGSKKDTMMFVDYHTLPAEQVQIFVDGKAQQEMEFKTKDLGNQEISLYAQVGKVKSKVKTIKLRKPPVAVAKRVVDVVFHVFELEPTDPSYDPLTYQVIEQRHLEQAVAYANLVFANANGKDPNGANAAIEFRLAKKNVAGANLALPGYNKIMYNSSWRASSFFSLADFTKKINATNAYQWNKEKFLNIYLLPLTASNSLGIQRANYQIVPAGSTPIPGVANIVNSIADVPTTDFYTTFGLGIHRNIFFPGMDRNIEIASYLGVYYGLYRTTVVDDYVSDTRKYTFSNNITNSLLKIGNDGEKFLANNALDDIRYPSLRNSFTLGQVERMRLLMERSPVRSNWTTEN